MIWLIHENYHLKYLYSLQSSGFWLLSEKIWNLLPCNQMFDKDLQSRNEVSPGSITTSSPAQLYFLSGGICNLNTGLMKPKWYKQYKIKSDDWELSGGKMFCLIFSIFYWSGWRWRDGIKSLKPNLSGMTLYKLPSPALSSLLKPSLDMDSLDCKLSNQVQVLFKTRPV